MQSERLSSERVRDSARFVATELLREPVKTAVRDALHEEAAIHDSDAETIRTGGDRSTVETHGETATSSGRSRRLWGGLLLATVGIAYLARRRMSSSSTWSEPTAGPGETGYATEGEVQTGETSGEDRTSTGGTGHSQTTEP